MSMGPYGTPVNSNPSVTPTSSQVLSKNPSRTHLLLYNPGTEKAYVAFGASAVFGEGAYFVPEKGFLRLEINSESDLWMTDTIHIITNICAYKLYNWLIYKGESCNHKRGDCYNRTVIFHNKK